MFWHINCRSLWGHEFMIAWVRKREKYTSNDGLKMESSKRRGDPRYVLG